MVETVAAARVKLGEVELEVFGRGEAGGAPLVFLHDLDYLNGADYAFVEELARDRGVLLPSHPGFGGSSLPEHFDTVEDLALVYLEWLEQLGAVHLIGAGFGGWIAAEMAVRCSHHLASLTLVDALGIKVGDRTTVDIQDFFVMSPRQLLEVCWHNPELGHQRMPLPAPGAGFDEDTLTQLLANRRTAALLAWNPFMHNPRLRKRLGRIDVPTLVVWGAADRLVTSQYGRAFAESIPHAQFALIDQAGHYPYLEQPTAFVHVLDAFLRHQEAAAA